MGIAFLKERNFSRKMFLFRKKRTMDERYEKNDRLLKTNGGKNYFYWTNDFLEQNFKKTPVFYWMNYFFENTHFWYNYSSWAVLINFNSPFTPLITSIYTGQGFKAFYPSLVNEHKKRLKTLICVAYKKKCLWHTKSKFEKPCFIISRFKMVVIPDYLNIVTKNY